MLKHLRNSLATLLLLSSCGTNRSVYKTADFREQAPQVRTVAVLPFYITYSGHRPRNVTEQDIKTANERWGYDFQEGLYTQLLTRTGRKRKGPATAFQSLQKTTALLKESGMTVEDMYKKKPEDLARLLEVDAVIMTTMDQHKNMSDGAAYGLAVTRGILYGTGQSNTANNLWFNSDNIMLNSYLYEAKSSGLLWKTFRQGGTSLPNTVQGLIAFYSDWIARKFPFKS